MKSGKVHETCANQSEPEAPCLRVRDPVCGMNVRPETAAGSLDYKGQTYYFCNKMCVEKFRSDPERYLGSAKPPAALRTHEAQKMEAGSPSICYLDSEVRQTRGGRL